MTTIGSVGFCGEKKQIKPGKRVEVKECLSLVVAVVFAAAASVAAAIVRRLNWRREC